MKALTGATLHQVAMQHAASGFIAKRVRVLREVRA
jgi:hypothetical protein